MPSPAALALASAVLVCAWCIPAYAESPPGPADLVRVIAFPAARRYTLLPDAPRTDGRLIPAAQSLTSPAASAPVRRAAAFAFAPTPRAPFSYLVAPYARLPYMAAAGGDAAAPGGAMMQQAEGQRLSEWGTDGHKSYLIPAIEIPAFVLALNLVARTIYPNDREYHGMRTYETNGRTFWDNLWGGHWQFDKDSFSTNQLRHPYQGAMYYLLARSSGLGYWTSWGYTLMGSFLWETGGETTLPSINDQIMSGVTGVFLGEPLFRMSSLILEEGGERPGFWREFFAFVVSPPTGFNRFVFGERFDPVFQSRDAAHFWRVDTGMSFTTGSSGHVTGIPNVAAVSNFTFLYGLPGKPGYSYDRPFDYFHFELGGATGPEALPENVTTRGLIYGTDYEVGDSYRGIWGLYGSYDYISPHTFRISTAGLSIGTTAQWWLSERVALMGSALAGGGYGAGGTVPGGDPDYHHGGLAQGLLSLRLIFGDLAMIDAAGRQYYIDQFGTGKPPGNALIGRYEGGLTVRITGRHAVSLRYIASSYNEYDVPASGGRHQNLGTFMLMYTIMKNEGFGAVEWREGAGR